MQHCSHLPVLVVIKILRYQMAALVAASIIGGGPWMFHARAAPISLEKGSSSTFSPRTMTKGGEALGYNLYMDASRTLVWGDGTSGTSVYARSNPPNDTNVSLPIYRRVGPAQDVSAGAYSDTVLATINF